jgi:hypothetical protein
MESPPQCSNCQYVYDVAETPPCPRCGKSAVTHSKHLVATLELFGSMRRVGKRASGFRFFEGVSRMKRARKSGNLADEALEYDRSDPAKTVKRHLVREQQPGGSWKVVHDEHEEYPSKRRSQ